MNQKEIEEYLIKKSKLINPSPNRFIIPAKEYLKDYANKHNIQILDFKILFYFYINNITTIPICQLNECREYARFKSYNEGFSIGCTHNHAKKISNRIKYGTDTPFESNEIQKKVKLTFLNKYGNSKPTSTINFKEKMLEKYGVTTPMHSNIIKTKQQNKLIKKYGGMGTASHEIMEKVQKKRIETFLRKIDNETYPSKRLFTHHEFNGVKGYETKYSWICKKCEFEFKCTITDGLIALCPKCYPKLSSGISKLETKLFESIPSKNKIQNNRTILNGKELDIYIPDKKLAIEFNGIYWHSEANGKDKNYHLDKTIKCEAQGIQLLHIFESEWLYQNDIMKSIINVKLGYFEIRIAARKCQIREIDIKTKNDFLKYNDLQGIDDAIIQLGLFYRDELISVMTFSEAKSTDQWYLKRFCTKLNYQVIGGASKLWKYFLKKYNPKYVQVQVDRRYSEGDVFEKIGFMKTEVTEPNFFIFGQQIVGIKAGIESNIKPLLNNYDSKLTILENIQNNDYGIIWDCGYQILEYINHNPKVFSVHISKI